MYLSIMAVFLLTSLLMLIAHSYVYKGLRVTVNFFIFGFLWISLVIGAIIITFNIPLKFKEGISPFFVFGTTASFLISIGILIIFYISWHMSEKVLSRFVILNKRLFPILLLSGLTTIFLLPYCIEAAKININTWQQGVGLLVFKDFSFKEYTFFISRYWNFFMNNFLIAFSTFFLIEYSKYKNTNWNPVFVLALFVHFWIMRFLPIETSGITSIVNLFLFGALLLLSIFSSLSFEYDRTDYDKNSRLKNLSWLMRILDIMPIFIIAILVFMAGINTLILKKWLHIIFIIPVGFLILLSIPRVPFSFIFISALLPVFIWKTKSIFIILPVLVYLLFQITERSIKRSSVK
ncbi:MAG: hypothetical protein Q7O04_01595 [Candidatus Omnitrophota bacterium]|nr:hypothetical protein [Candidatus Omnitrophota bacterium]